MILLSLLEAAVGSWIGSCVAHQFFRRITFGIFFWREPKDMRSRKTQYYIQCIVHMHMYMEVCNLYLRTIITSVHIVTIDCSSADRRKYNIICWERKGVLVMFRIREMAAITFLNSAPATWICFQQFLSQNEYSGSINLFTRFWIWNQGKSTQLLLAVQGVVWASRDKSWQPAYGFCLTNSIPK